MAITTQEEISGGFVRDLDGRQVVVLAATGVGAATGVQSVSISTAASGQTALVSAVAGKQIVVVGFAVVASGAVTVQFQSASSALTGAMAFAANGGLSIAPGPTPLFTTAVNTTLNINLGGAVQVSGFLTYYLL